MSVWANVFSSLTKELGMRLLDKAFEPTIHKVKNYEQQESSKERKEKKRSCNNYEKEEKRYHKNKCKRYKKNGLFFGTRRYAKSSKS